MTAISERDGFAIFIDSFEGLDYKIKLKLLEEFDGFPKPEDIERFFAATKPEIGLSISQAMRNKKVVEERIGKSVQGLDGIIPFYSEDYPELLRQTPVFPLILYYKGNKELLKSEKKLAIVGSRKTLPQYLAKTEEIAAAIAESGVPIVTGIADGGDTSAVMGSMKSGKTISVLAGGLNPVYTKSKQGLAASVAKYGLILSENPCGVAPRTYSYPVRNRIIAGLSDVSLIVSGEADSGARYTASYALDYGRDVACLPYGLGVKSGELCKSLIKSGAAEVETSEEVAFMLGITLEKTAAVKLNDKEKSVYESIKSGIDNVDELALKTGEKVWTLTPVIASLEIKKVIVKNTDGRLSVLK